MSEWEIVDNNILVNSDFKNDAALLLSGDWNNEKEMAAFLKGVCDKLNRPAAPITHEDAGQVTFWLVNILRHLDDEKMTRLRDQLSDRLPKKDAPITAEMVAQSLLHTLTAVNDPASFNSMCRCDYQKVADQLNEIINGNPK